MLDYRFHYAQLVAEDRLRTPRHPESSRPVTRIHHREAPTGARRAAVRR